MADLFEALSDADDAGLFYVTDTGPGIARRKRGKGFSYHGPDGTAVDAETKEWIASLAIPPAWTDVWICPLRDGHILATGRDAKGRKQYRYHDKWRELRVGGLPKEKVLAAVVKLLDETNIRVGNDEYATMNESYGLTTMQEQHAVVEGSVVHFEFTGKSGIEAEIDLKDRRLASIVRAC